MSTSLTPTRSRPRVGTISWGVVLLVAAALLLAGQFFSLSIDPVILTLGLLVGVGLSLVIGGVLSLGSRRTDASDHLDRDDHEAAIGDTTGY